MKATSSKRARIWAAASVVIVLALVGLALIIVNRAPGADTTRKAPQPDSASSEKALSEPSKNLKDNIDVKLGKFSATTDKYGLISTSLPVTVRNKLDSSISYNITIQAFDESGELITEDYVFVERLDAKRTEQFKVFKELDPGELEYVKEATFKVTDVSQI